MKLFILILFNFLVSYQPLFAQKKKAKPKTKIENVHMYYDISPEPEASELELWVPKITKEMRAKWNLDNEEVTLSFIVEKNGTLTDPRISSQKWKPTKQDLIDLNKIINSQGKWKVAKIGKNIVRGKYFLTLEFL